MAALAPADGGGGKPPWCEREELLASMYSFTHRSCSALQDEQYVRGFIGILQPFVKSLTVGLMAGRGCGGGRREAGACSGESSKW